MSQPVDEIGPTELVADDLAPGVVRSTERPDVSVRAWLKCFNFSRAKFYLPLALCTGASYVLKKGFMSWLVLFVCTLGSCVLLLPVGYAIWRQQQLTGTDN